MAGEHHCYDSDGDVSRYMLDDMEFPLFGEADVDTTLPLPVVLPVPTPATTHVEPTPAADLGLGNPVLADLGFDVDLGFFPELNFQPQPPAMNAGGYSTHQVQASPVMHHQQQQPLAPLPAHGFAGQPTTMAPSGDVDGLFLAPSRDAPGSPLMFNFMDFNVDMGGVDMDDVLMWADDTHGASAGDTAPPVVDEYANFVPFQAGDLDCSNCHLVREMMHSNASRTIYFLVHATTGVGSFQHAIVDRRYPAAGAEGLHFSGSQLLYFDLTNHTVESASDFIASNVEKLRHDTSGHHFFDTGYNFSGAVRTDMANSHTVMEMNMLHSIVSAPFENATADAASPAAQFMEAPPAAELPAPAPAPVPPEAAHEQNVVATFLFKVEEFYATANSRPAAKRPDVKILESSQVTQQAGGSAATATMYPSMVDRKRKRAQATPLRMAPHEVIQYLRVTAVDTDKELETLNEFFKVCNEEDKTLITFPVEQVRNIKKKIGRIINKPITAMSSRRMARFIDEIDTIKEEKARAFEEIIKILKNPRRKRENDGSSGSNRKNVGRSSGSKKKNVGGSSGSKKKNVGRPSAKKAQK
uniref:Uncharacterized protein n=1 Tax=Oryza punctata TaxID=4537 RepID=A0A0E0JYX4_ORYPU